MFWETSRNDWRWKPYVPDGFRSTDSKLKIHRTDRYGMPDDELIHTITLQKHENKPIGWSVKHGIAKDAELQHYGVPGMHWGEITKEYIPKGYYKQRTMSAAQYRKQQQTKNAVSAQYQAAKNVGRSIGESFFLDARRNQQRKKQEAYEAAHPKEKGPDIVDKTTKKVFDHFSLGAYSQLASKFIKDTVQNKTIDYLKKNSGKVVKVGGKFIGQLISRPVSLAGKGVIAGGHGLESLARAGIRKLPKGLGQAAKFIGKTGANTIRSLGKVSKWYRGHRKEIQNGINAGRSFIVRLANTTHRISNLTGSAVSSGAKLAQTGAKGLVSLLKRIRR